MIGIYKITNKINKKVYIGQSCDITRRWRQHRSSYQTIDNHLYRSMKKFGLENFNFDVIEECSLEELDEKEKYWIKYYNSTDSNKGYNLTNGGKDSVKCSLSEEQIDGIYSMLQNNISQQIIADKYNISQQMVSLINLGQAYIRENISYPIRDIHNKSYCIDCGIPVTNGYNRCHKCATIYATNLHYKNNNYPDRETLKRMIKELSFVAIGKKYNVTDNAVRRWCEHYKLPKTKREINSYSDEEWELI